MPISRGSTRAPQCVQVLAWLALSLLAACSSPTSTDPLIVSLEHVVLATDAERIAWPSTPTIAGGPSIRVRGIAFVGCGHARAAAEGRGDFVRVAITAVEANGPCLANRDMWAPFEAHISGVRPGSYRVWVSVVGHEGHAEWRVAISDL